MMALLISILITAVLAAPPSFISVSDMRTGLYNAIPPNGGLYNASTPSSHVFNPTYSTALPSSVGATVGIVGFQTPKTYNFNINITIDTYSTTSITVRVIVYGDMRIIKLDINYLVIGSAVNAYLEIYSSCLETNNLKTGSGPRADLITRNTKFTIGQLSTITILSAFQLTNTLGNTSILKASSYQLPQSQTINTIFQSDQNNTISSICYTSIVLNIDLSLSTNRVMLGMVGSRSLSNISSGSYMDVGPVVMEKYQDANRMFFGMSGFRILTDNNRIWSLNTSSYADLGSNYLSNIAIIEVVVNFFWNVERQFCNASQYYDFNTNDCVASCTLKNTVPGYFCLACHYSCSSCSSGQSNQCSGCSAAKFRQNLTALPGSCSCMIGYVDMGEQLCYPCKSIIRGCSTCQVANYAFKCTSCGLFNTVYNGSTIIDCPCYSSNGYFNNAQQLCINTTGCTNYSIINTNTTAQCSLCNTSQNFKPTVNSIRQCECQTGYTLTGPINSSTSTCNTVCGDGIMVGAQQCDDGNNNNGDGCSSVCIIETNWYCNNTLRPSVCALVAPTSIKLIYVKRIIDSNKMRVAVRITPYTLSYSASTLKSLITHNIPASDYSVDYSNGILLLDFNYNQTIEGNTYSISLKLDPTNATRIYSLQVPAFGMNARLTYDSSYSQIPILQVVILIGDGLALLLLILSLFSQKLIGVELIITIQSIFYLMAFMQSCPSPLYPLFQLRYSTGYNYQLGNQQERYFLENFSTSTLGIEKQFLLSFNIMLVLLVLCMVMMLGTKVLLYCKDINSHTNKAKQFKQAHQKSVERIKMVMNFILQRVFFVLCFLTLFTIIFALAYQMRDIPSFNIFLIHYSFSVGTAFLSVIIVVGFEMLVIYEYIFPGNEIFKHKSIKPIYPVFLVIYETIYIILISFDFNQNIMMIGMIIITFISIVALCIIKPYPETKHNIALYFHKVVILLATLVYTIAQFTKGDNQTTYYAACYLIIALIYLLIIIDGYRLWNWRTNNLMKPTEFLDEQTFAKVNAKNLKKKKQKEIYMQNLQPDQKVNYKQKDFQWIYNEQQLNANNNNNTNTNNHNNNNQFAHLSTQKYQQEDQAEQLRQLKKRLKKQYKQRFQQEQSIEDL